MPSSTATIKGIDALSIGQPISPGQAMAVALIMASNRIHNATDEATCTRLGFLRITKGGQTSINSDRVFVELAHERYCRPRPTAVSGPLDALCQVFADLELEVSLHAARNATA
jgi:hypothetical protein